MTDWNRMFGLGNGLGALPSNAGVGLTPEDAQALGIDTQQAETQAAQSPLGSPVPVSPNSLGPLSPQLQSQNTPSATPLSSSVSTGGQAGVSGEVSTKGWSGASYDNIVAKTRPGDLRGSAQSRETAGEYEQKTGQEYADALGAKAGSIVDQTQLNSRIADSKMELESEKARLLNEHAGEIQKMQEVVQAKTEKASADYAGQLAMIAATRIDHNQLYHDKGAAGKIAMLASSFVGGILDAKGVKNNIQGTLMKTIDDNVSDQIANLNNQKDVAQGFLQLYNMAVADGSNQIAAKTKLQGMYLTAFEQQATAELSKYGSELAKSTGKAALADLAMEKAKINEKVRKDAWDLNNALEGQRIAQRGQDMSAATAAAQLKFQEKAEAHRREDAKAASDAGQMDLLRKTIVLDASQGGKPLRRALTEDGAKLVNVAHSAAAANLKDFTELEDLIKKAGSTGYGGKSGQLFNSEDEKRARSLWKRMVANSLRVQSGAAVNEAEVERKEQEIGDTNFLASLGSVDTFRQLLRDGQRRDIQKVQAWDDTYTVPLSPAQIEWARANGLSGESLGTDDQFGAPKLSEIAAGDDKRAKEKSGYKSPDDQLAEKAASPSHDIHTGVAPASIPDSWKKYGKDSGWTTELADPELRKGLMKLTPEQRQTAIEMAGGEGPDTAEPVYVPHMDALALILSDDKATSERKQWAAAQLLNIAATAKDSTQADYAQYLAKSVGVEYDDRQLQQIRATGAVPKGSDVSGRLQQDLDLLRMSE